MAYEVVLSRAARKAVRALPEATKRRVLRALKDLEADRARRESSPYRGMRACYAGEWATTVSATA